MKQQTLAMAVDQTGYEQYRKPTRRDEFLATILRRFVGIELDRERVPDATMMLKFRRLLSQTLTLSAKYFRSLSLLSLAG